MLIRLDMAVVESRNPCASICYSPNVRQIIWSAALKQKVSGPVYSRGEATLSQQKETEITQFVGLSNVHSSTLDGEVGGMGGERGGGAL